MVGIIIALESEAKEILAKLQCTLTRKIANKNFYLFQTNNTQGVLGISGIGKVNAALTTQILINCFKVDKILNIGTCGGLEKNMNIGDIFTVRECMQYDFDLSELDNVEKGFIQGFNSKFFSCNIVEGYKIQNLGSADKFSNDIQPVNFLIKNNVFLKDMEGAAIAQVCSLNKIPLYIVKGVTDVYGTNKEIPTQQFKNNLELVNKNLKEEIENILKKI